MTAVVAEARRRAGRRAGALLKARRDDAGQHRRRGERAAVRHVLPAAWATSRGRPSPSSTPRRSPRRCGPASRASSRGGRPQLGDKTMMDALAPGRRRAATPRWPTARRSRDALRGRGDGRAERRGRDRPLRGPQGPGQLPGRAQRGHTGPRRDVDDAAARGRGAEPRVSRRDAQRRDRRGLAQPGAGATPPSSSPREVMRRRRRARSRVAAGLDETTLGTDAAADRHRDRDVGPGRRRARADGPGQRGALAPSWRWSCSTPSRARAGACSARRRWSRAGGGRGDRGDRRAAGRGGRRGGRRLAAKQERPRWRAR